MPRNNIISRGLIPRILKQAGDISETRMMAAMRYQDEMTDVAPGDVLGAGGKLSRKDFRLLLASDKDTQERVMAQWPFATERERDAIRRDLARLEEAQPDASALPPAVVTGPNAVPQQGVPLPTDVPFTQPPPPDQGLMPAPDPLMAMPAA